MIETLTDMTEPSTSSYSVLPIADWPVSLSWQPTVKQQQQLQQLYELILQGNQQLNLTRITEPLEFWEKHLWDSLRGIAPWLGAEATEANAASEQGSSQMASPVQQVIDIGTGGGFPGVPVAIARPDWSTTLLDSTRKKVAFLENLVRDLGLSNVKTLSGRAEAIGQQKFHRGQFDLALIRAVGPANVCAEYALPLVRQGGAVVLYRGQWTEAENADLERAVPQLGGQVTAIESFTTPISQAVRHCIYLRKTQATPSQFPRAVGVPSQKPL